MKYDNDLNGYFENGKFIPMHEKIKEHRTNLVNLRKLIPALNIVDIDGRLVSEKIYDCQISENGIINFFDNIYTLTIVFGIFVLGFILGFVFKIIY